MKTTELCPRLNQNPTLSGRLPAPHELAGRVVDGCDVIGVECVPHAERVCRYAQSDPQELTADRVAVRCHDADQHAPADEVQQQDEAAHAPQAASFIPGDCGVRG